MEDTKVAYSVSVNTDLTEGRGRQVIKAICETAATAARIASKANVQGSNGIVRAVTIERRDGHWFGPITVIPATVEDGAAQERLDAASAARAKAVALGLSDAEIAALSSPDAPQQKQSGPRISPDPRTP